MWPVEDKPHGRVLLKVETEKEVVVAPVRRREDGAALGSSSGDSCGTRVMVTAKPVDFAATPEYA